MASSDPENTRRQPLMSIGQFSRRSQLSPKALRLYGELGLLQPAEVDESSGYRLYAEVQLERARLVATLRELRFSLAEISSIVDLDRSAAAERIAQLWGAQERQLAARRQLAAHLINRLNGKRSEMYEVSTRQIPARTVLCLKRNVPDQDAAWSLGKEFVGMLRGHDLPRLPGRVGAAFQIYWGEVNDDSDGPIEWCRPVPPDQADALAAACPELTLRTEPEHEEAFVHLGPGGETTPAQWQLVSETMRAWAQERGIRPTELGARITYLADAPASPDAGPDCDFAIPFTESPT